MAHLIRKTRRRRAGSVRKLPKGSRNTPRFKRQIPFAVEVPNVHGKRPKRPILIPGPRFFG